MVGREDRSLNGGFMMETVLLGEIPQDLKEALLRELGLGMDGDFVVDKGGDRVVDRYTREPVLVRNMIIMPGSTKFLDNNPLSIASYFEEFGDPI